MENLDTVYKIVNNAYKGLQISEEHLREFAIRLNERVFIEECALNDIFEEVCEFEEMMRAEGIQIELSKSCYVFDDLIRCLEINAPNAKRLYDSFMEYLDIVVFELIMSDFKEFFTEKEIAEVLEIGKENFIKEVWEIYV